MITEEFIRNAIEFEREPWEDRAKYGLRANALHRGWTELGKVFKDMTGWESHVLDDGFHMVKPTGADDRVCSYLYVKSDNGYSYQVVTNICTDIDQEWGEPFYATYECLYAPDVLPLLIAFGV